MSGWESADLPYIPDLVCEQRVSTFLTKLTGWVQEPTTARGKRKIDPRLRALSTRKGAGRVTDKIVAQWINFESLAPHYLGEFRRLLEEDGWHDPHSPIDGLHVVVLGLIDHTVPDWNRRVERCRPPMQVTGQTLRDKQARREARKDALRAYAREYEAAYEKHRAELAEIDRLADDSEADYRRSLGSKHLIPDVE